MWKLSEVQWTQEEGPEWELERHGAILPSHLGGS